jgi:hypothetical protein
MSGTGKGFARNRQLLFLEASDLAPQLPGKYDSGAMDRQRRRFERFRRPGVAGVQRRISWRRGEIQAASIRASRVEIVRIQGLPDKGLRIARLARCDR